MKEYLNIAWRNLKRRRLRSWLTMIGIFISVAIIFILFSLSIGLQTSIEEQFRQLGSDKFFVMARGQLAGPGTGGAVELTENDIDAINRVSGVRDSTYWVASTAKVEFRGQVRFVTVIGLELDGVDLYVETGFYNEDEGKFLQKGDSKRAMIGSQYKYNDFYNAPVSAGDKIEINDVDFKVKAIFESVGNPADDRVVYIPMKDFRELFPETGERIDQIMVQVEQGQEILEVALKAEKRLRSARDVDEDTQDFTVLTPEELLDTFGAVLNILTGFLLGVAAISLLVGGIGVANTMYTSVVERTKEIGVMKAVGARNTDIMALFTIEAGLIGLVGGILGVLIGLIFVKTLEFVAIQQLGLGILRAATPFYLFVGSLAFSLFVGALSGLWPAWKASKIRPVDALRYE
jgi:putative ABC transport system permease protein